MKLINKLLSQKKFIVGSICGAVLATSITYGVSQLSSESVSYTKDNKTITVKQALDELINTSLTRIDDLEAKAKIYKYAYLYDAVNVGDYVDYDAGNWTADVPIPSVVGEFGGYKANTSKNASVVCWEPRGTTDLKGWRVLKKVNNQVYLVHAGQPECHYHKNGYNDTSIEALNKRANEYKNEYAVSAHAMNYQEAYDIDKTELDVATNNDLRKTGAFYYLATPYQTEDDKNWLYGVRQDGAITYIGYATGLATGFRPVVVLKAGILTTGKGTDEFGQPAWKLVEMK